MPPILTPRSLQIARALKQLTALNWDCTVLTVDAASLRKHTHSLDDSLEQLYRGDFRIVRAPTPENVPPIPWVRRQFFRLNPPGAQALLFSKALWVPSAVRVGRTLLEQGDYSAVASFAMPWASHVVGRALAPGRAAVGCALQRSLVG
jgi:hypothetical protein